MRSSGASRSGSNTPSRGTGLRASNSFSAGLNGSYQQGLFGTQFFDLEVARGESLGLTGPNGSGRTTLLRIVATLVPPSSGSVKIDGLDAVRDVYRLRPRLAYVGTESVEPERLRVDECVRMVLTARRRPAT